MYIILKIRNKHYAYNIPKNSIHTYEYILVQKCTINRVQMKPMLTKNAYLTVVVQKITN